MKKLECKLRKNQRHHHARVGCSVLCQFGTGESFGKRRPQLRPALPGGLVGQPVSQPVDIFLTDDWCGRMQSTGCEWLFPW